MGGFQLSMKGKFENVYGPERENSSASQRQQLPLQHDSSEGALPLATTATSAPKEPSPSSPGKAPSHCVPVTEHLHTHPSAAPVQVWLLPLNSYSAPGIPMITMGRNSI